ncbi:MAG: hypothetical protein MZV70_40395 [Desulfobacterales bacterium]|nr:hypothetical protein [Desulfobacterales bacterium]
MATKEPAGNKIRKRDPGKDREARPVAASGHPSRPWSCCSSVRRPGSCLSAAV